MAECVGVAPWVCPAPSESEQSVSWAEGWWQEAMEVASEGADHCPCLGAGHLRVLLGMGPPSSRSIPLPLHQTLRGKYIFLHSQEYWWIWVVQLTCPHV